MKMRVMEKVFHSLVNSALDRYGESQLDRKKRNILAATIELCMKSEVVGNVEKGIVSQWKFRWTKEHSMEKPSLTGSVAQKILSHMKSLTRVAFSEDLDEDALDCTAMRIRNSRTLHKWNEMCDNLSKLWKLIEQRSDYVDEDIDLLHILCNRFMNHWMDLMGSEHMTNYIHIIGSGHLTFFAAKYRNLYRFSQQGWESLNQLLKHYYFNNTNHGGAAGNGGKNCTGQYTNAVISGDHCRPLMLLCQRSIMWKLGVGDSYFKGMQIEKKNNLLDMMDADEEEEHMEAQVRAKETMMYGIL